LTKPPQWLNGCLNVSIDRVNHSSVTLFLPYIGLYISTSVSKVEDDLGGIQTQGWINVYGVTDLLFWGATPIAPGATVHGDYCLPPEVPVVSLEKKTRRKIPLRGRLRIDAYYFLTEQDWHKNEAQHEQMMNTPSAQRDRIDIKYPEVVTIFAKTPCRETDCTSICDTPPVILHDETRVVPDFGDSQPDWDAQGKMVGDELDREAPTCAGTRPIPH